MKCFDFNCFAGSWPFHKLRCGTATEMIALHQKKGIDGGIFSSLNAIFYQDPLEGDLDLAKELVGTGYGQYLTVNPFKIGWLEDLKRGIGLLQPAGVRIYPGFHGYSLLDNRVTELCRAVVAEKLPFIVTHRMEDVRITYLLHPSIPTAEEYRSFLKNHNNLPILITHMLSPQLLEIKEALHQHNHAFFDASGLNQTPFPFEDIIKEGLGEKIIFGSNAPLCSLSAVLHMAQSENIPAHMRAQLFSGEKLFSTNVTG